MLSRKYWLAPTIGFVTTKWSPIGAGVAVTAVHAALEARFVVDWRVNPVALFVCQLMTIWLPNRFASRVGGSADSAAISSGGVP